MVHIIFECGHLKSVIVQFFFKGNSKFFTKNHIQYNEHEETDKISPLHPLLIV